MKPVYKPGTPLSKIIVDGWSRGFRPEQTLLEAYAQGHETSIEEIKAVWAAESVKMKMYFRGHPYANRLESEKVVDVEEDFPFKP